LVELVYDELRPRGIQDGTAAAPLNASTDCVRVGSLVRLVGDKSPTFKSRTHFFWAAAEAPERNNSSISIADRLEFSRWILVYLHEDVPDMEFSERKNQ
jgi:hypothetical protein